MLYFFSLNHPSPKYQVVHEQKFKDLLSSTWQVSVERRLLDLESEAMRGLSSISTGGNIVSLDFFHVVKPLMAILALLPISSSLCIIPSVYVICENIWFEFPRVNTCQTNRKLCTRYRIVYGIS